MCKNETQLQRVRRAGRTFVRRRDEQSTSEAALVDQPTISHHIMYLLTNRNDPLFFDQPTMTHNSLTSQ